MTENKKQPLPRTKEEEADEIVRRLRTPPTKPKTIDEELMEVLQDEIRKEIDEKILSDLLREYDERKRTN